MCYNTDMRNLRSRYSYTQRLEFNDNVQSIRKYLMRVLLDRQNNVCDMCHFVIVEPSPNLGIVMCKRGGL